jgi:tight adherence protein C
MNSFLVSTAIFCLAGVAAMAIYAAFFGSHRTFQERFAEITARDRFAHGANPFAAEAEAESVGRMFLQWALARMPEPKENPGAKKIAQMLTCAGFIRSGAVRVFQLARIFTLAIGALLGFAAAYLWFGHAAKAIAFALMGGVAGWVGPLYYLQKRATRRQTEIARQLSDVLDLLVVCVEAGLGLFEAIKIVGDETDRQEQAIGKELTLVAGEVAAGNSLGQALRNLAERTAVEDVRPLAATLIQSEQLGAQIGPALRASSDSLRVKRRLRAEEAAQKSTIKILFPLVLFVLPAMLLAILAPAMIQAMRTLTVP